MCDIRFTHHGNGVGGQQLLGTHGRDVGDIGKDVDKGHQGDGDENGARKVPGKGQKEKAGGRDSMEEMKF